jgi:thiol-disulfide isomerase/thioredoxin
MAFAALCKPHVKTFPVVVLKYVSSVFVRVLTSLLVGWLMVGAHADEASPLDASAKVVALVFVSTECPISNKFAPELERLARRFATNDVSVVLVYPNASDTEVKIEKHRREYHLTGRFVRDTKQVLVKKAGATITPEAAVFNDQRKLVYRGRVNDQYLSLSKERPRPTQHDLEQAITALLDGKRPKQARTEAVGCFIQK